MSLCLEVLFFVVVVKSAWLAGLMMRIMRFSTRIRAEGEARHRWITLLPAKRN